MAKPKVPTIKDLYEAGVHFGHQVRRWHPAMEPYIYTVKNNIHIINLEKTEQGLKQATDFLYETAKAGKQIIFVGTKKQAVELVRLEAKRCGALYVTERWLGGTLTNYRVIKNRIDGLVDLMRRKQSGDLEKYTKKERLLIDREIEKLQNSVGGLIGLEQKPGAVFVIDSKREKTAIKEATKKGVPVVALIDTNSNPENIDYIIPGNDDALKSLALIIKTIADAVEKGYADHGKQDEKAKQQEKKTGEEQPAGNIVITESESTKVTQDAETKAPEED